MELRIAGSMKKIYLYLTELVSILQLLSRVIKNYKCNNKFFSHITHAGIFL